MNGMAASAARYNNKVAAKKLQRRRRVAVATETLISRKNRLSRFARRPRPFYGGRGTKQEKAPGSQATTVRSHLPAVRADARYDEGRSKISKFRASGVTLSISAHIARILRAFQRRFEEIAHEKILRLVNKVSVDLCG